MLVVRVYINGTGNTVVDNVTDSLCDVVPYCRFGVARKYGICIFQFLEALSVQMFQKLLIMAWFRVKLLFGRLLIVLMPIDAPYCVADFLLQLFFLRLRS
jgi:hypothetical protein